MDLFGVGFANIRMPNDSNDYTYKYDYRINIFPEEVYIHEFLHTLERTCVEYGYDIPELHAYNDFGYESQKLITLKQWYQDYMQKKVLDKSTNSYVGLCEEVYKYKPAHKSNFDYSIDVKFNVEPKNIFEEVKGLIDSVVEAM